PFVGLLLLSAVAELPAQKAKSRVDAHGDLLPEGVVARLGSTRLRVVGDTVSLAFGHDDNTLLALNDGAVIVWDRASGKEIRRFSVLTLVGIPFPRTASLSPRKRARTSEYGTFRRESLCKSCRWLKEAITRSCVFPTMARRLPWPTATRSSF